MRSFLIAIMMITMVPVLSLVGQQPEPAGQDLLRLEGTDLSSGIHYLRIFALLPSSDHAAGPDSVPRFAFECRERAGKRNLHWFVRFNGSSDFAFQAPFQPTTKTPFAPPNPSLDLKMHFEGYMKSQEFKRQWELLPTGELHYRNSGMNSPNLDDPMYFVRWLNSLPNLRLTYAKPVAGQPKELVFPLKALLTVVNQSAICQP